MDTRRVLLVGAFTEEPMSGTAAGLVPDADGLTAAQMRAVAGELGASGTAFLLPSGSADRRGRYFTPTAEVDRFDPATVAAHTHLRASGTIAPGAHTLETNAGVLDVEAETDGRAWVTREGPTVRAVALDADRVAEAIGVDPVALEVDGLPFALASTGLPFLVVPVRLLSDLGGAGPDATALESLSDAVDAAGVYAFTFDTLEADSTLHGRTWTPGRGTGRGTGTGTGPGVVEDPLTGAASGAVGAYLRRFDAFDEMPDELRVEGGHYVDRPGRVFVRVGERVEVGGHATVALDGELRVPEVDHGGDIIEG